MTCCKLTCLEGVTSESCNEAVAVGAEALVQALAGTEVAAVSCAVAGFGLQRSATGGGRAMAKQAETSWSAVNEGHPVLQKAMSALRNTL